MRSFSGVPRDQRGVFVKELSDSVDDGIDRAAELGLGGAHLNSPLEVDPALDPGALAAFADRAAALGLRLGVGVGSLNPFRPDRSPEAFTAGRGDLDRGFFALVAASVSLGCHTPMVVVGREEDRFASPTPWTDQLAAVGALLTRLAPALRELGARVLIKTHQELTTFEAARLVESVGSDVTGVAFDPTNSIVRMEHPVTAASRLAGLIGQVHVDDARLVAWGDGLGRALVPIGGGDVDWTAVVAAVASTDPTAMWWGEIHRAELTMPFRQAGWMTAHPDAPLNEIATWLGTAAGQSEPTPATLLGDLPARIDAVTAALGWD
ncbi:sugar phosphate isomerase/epimerase family protein [Agromyces sp. SYSU T00194]|uniref:sugar phosphate isomerase/epimerase family protein n=1 Tax=Agromyces chitinivorans TaxID=3158560 RepID=UPI0033924F45